MTSFIELKRAVGRQPPVARVYDFLKGGDRWRRFLSDYREFRRLSAATGERFRLRWRDRSPCLRDRTASTGFDRHYVYHTSWAARVVQRIRPERHVDISSSLFFCGIVSAFVPVDFYDFRPADLKLTGLTSNAGDLMALPFASGTIRSLSCMHTIEHIGLGRYGDPLDPAGDLRAITELKRVLAPGGSLLLVVPVGQPRIQFNAHRIYAPRQILQQFDGFELTEFAMVPDDPAQGGLLVSPTDEMVERQRYACGCFWLTKRGPAS